MTRDAEHTPSPHSVVVPVEPTLPLHFDSVRIAAVLRAEAERLGKGVPSDLPGLHKDLWTAAEIIDMAEEATAFAHQMNAMLAAAPAPSSLAGGEWVREDYGNSTLLYTLKQQGWRKGEPIMVNDKTVRVEFDGDREPVIAAILAALSPEAPAREATAFAMTDGMTMHPTLRSANIARQNEWDQDNQISAAYRGNELAGEVGEACNVIKKLERERLGILGSRATVGELADELADVLICADLIAMHYGIDLEAAVARKFNATSEKVGLAARLAPPESASEV